MGVVKRLDLCYCNHVFISFFFILILLLSVGNICSYIRCVDVQYESKREEEFYDVQVHDNDDILFVLSCYVKSCHVMSCLVLSCSVLFYFFY